MLIVCVESHLDISLVQALHGFSEAFDWASCHRGSYTGFLCVSLISDDNIMSHTEEYYHSCHSNYHVLFHAHTFWMFHQKNSRLYEVVMWLSIYNH